ncbi:hypothetical protein CYMTET_36790 [Cymbomonas tetramitiformis]|uniref:Hexosyltransferase n=1 Tax=Cymbomonas tetramitiformis TaxID=36881 RepID=A0AAE0CF86_9CHLO|nr:hypothetical protein CYMTET_36790 [Cymbomonas tetramitiformis]
MRSGMKPRRSRLLKPNEFRKRSYWIPVLVGLLILFPLLQIQLGEHSIQKTEGEPQDLDQGGSPNQEGIPKLEVLHGTQTPPAAGKNRLVNLSGENRQVCDENVSTEAYLTFITGNQKGYIAGVLVLAKSLQQTGTKRKLVVMHLDDVPQVELQLLQSFGIQTVEVPAVPNPNCHGTIGRPCERGRDNYSKLAAFGLTQFTSLVYMDADMVVRRNIDELFCQKTFSSARIASCEGKSVTSCSKLNSGILVLQPNQAMHDDMMRKAPTMFSFNKGDQGFLTSYYTQPSSPPLSFLDNKVYNAKLKKNEKNLCYRGLEYDLAHPETEGTGKVVHFMDATKPWMNFNGRELVIDAITNYRHQCFKMMFELWWDTYLKVLDEVEGLEKYLLVESHGGRSTKRSPSSFMNFFAKKKEAPGDVGGEGYRNTRLLWRSPSNASTNLTTSVVIMNWKRPANVRKMLDALVTYAVVDDILVWHCNNDTKFTYDHAKVSIIDDVAANDRWGLSTRFQGASPQLPRQRRVAPIHL